MKLDRNIPENRGAGKYALVLLRKVEEYRGGTFSSIRPDILAAIKTLEGAGILDYGEAETDREFFVMRLKDRFAKAGLEAYADAAQDHDCEYATEVQKLASRSGSASPFCKLPD